METFDVNNYVMHHIINSQHWSLPFLPTIDIPKPLSLHALMLFICSIFLIITFCFIYDTKRKVPNKITNLLEVLVLFVRDHICVVAFGEKEGRRMAPLFCTFFFFILGLNLMGLIPLFSTATANINVTAGLATVTLMFMIFGGIYKNGILNFIKTFIPSGVPFPILFIITPIEFLGMFVRAFALTVRLFANMMAGHILILSLIGVIAVAGVKALPMAALVMFMYVLELMVAFLQAYIFTLFSAMFISQIYHPAH